MPQQEVTRPKPASAVFHLKNVSKLYDTDAPYLALNQVNLDIRDGEILCLLGASGCGLRLSISRIDRGMILGASRCNLRPFAGRNAAAE